MTNSVTAKRALGLIDLTNLNDNCTQDDISALCARATTPHGAVAAVCVWPAFVAQSVKALEGTGIGVATVVNFPAGGTDRRAVLAETKKAVSEGASDVDLVLPYHALMDGDVDAARAMVHMVRAATDGRSVLKVILETGELAESGLIRQACRLALEEGADFIKTSTGKVRVNATPDTAKIMLEELRQFDDPKRGFKPAGGIRSVADCATYLQLADDIMGPDWAQKSTFRFGASGVLDAVLAMLDGQDASHSGGGY